MLVSKGQNGGWFSSSCVAMAPASPELLLALPAEVSDEPLAGEGVLGRHAPAHHRVQEGLPLPRVEAQDLHATTDRRT